jgi:hypothetical protein
MGGGQGRRPRARRATGWEGAVAQATEGDGAAARSGGEGVAARLRTAGPQLRIANREEEVGERGGECAG